MRGDSAQNAAPHEPSSRAFAEKTLLSSGKFGWQGLVTATCLLPGGEFKFPASDDYLISLHLGPSIHLNRSGTEGYIRQERVVCGSTIIVPAGQPSVWQHTETSYFQNINLSAALLDRAAEPLATGQARMLAWASPASFHDPHIEQIAMLLRLEMETGALYGSLYAETLANALCVHLLRRRSDLAVVPAPAPPTPGLFHVELHRAADYIQDNLMTDLSLNMIAREAGISVYHLTHLFSQVFGVPPHQYVIQARIERAKGLVLLGELPLGEIAQLVGFADQSHFTRHFKRLVGTTPRVFAHGASHKNIP